MGSCIFHRGHFVFAPSTFVSLKQPYFLRSSYCPCRTSPPLIDALLTAPHPISAAIHPGRLDFPFTCMEGNQDDRMKGWKVVARGFIDLERVVTTARASRVHARNALQFLFSLNSDPKQQNYTGLLEIESFEFCW